MTPPVSKELMQSRPLFDPDPATFVAKSAMENKALRRCRLSDFAVVGLAINIQDGHLTKAEVDIFENVYVRGAKPRSMRVHEGRAALAPDGTVLSMGDEAYPGDTKEKAGPWTVASVKDCPGYKDWLADITQTEKDIMNNGGSEDMINQPLPLAAELATANAYTPTKPAKAEHEKKKTRVKRGPKTKEPEGEDDDNDDNDSNREGFFPGKVSGMINRIVNQISSFVDYVEENAKNPGHRESLNIILDARVRGALPKVPKRKKMKGGDAGESSGAEIDGGNSGATEDSPSDFNIDGHPDGMSDLLDDAGDLPGDVDDLPDEISISSGGGRKAAPKRKATGSGRPKAKKPRTARKSPAKKALAVKKTKGRAPKSNASAQVESDDEAAADEMAAEGEGDDGVEDCEHDSVAAADEMVAEAEGDDWVEDCELDSVNEEAVAGEGNNDEDDGEYTPGLKPKAKSGRKAGKR